MDRRITIKPSKYERAERIIRIVQAASLVIAAIAAIFAFSMITYAVGVIGTPGAIAMGLLVGAIYAAVILLVGALIWALLHGVLAVFDIAKDTADTKRIALHSLKATTAERPEAV